jgi:hypothetical protein
MIRIIPTTALLVALWILANGVIDRGIDEQPAIPLSSHDISAKIGQTYKALLVLMSNELSRAGGAKNSIAQCQGYIWTLTESNLNSNNIILIYMTMPRCI